MSDLEFVASTLVARSPDQIYAMVSDVTRMGAWSPICRACWWDDGAGPHVGAWFTGRNEVPGRTWETRSQVVAAEPGREFAWEVNNGWVRWGFTFQPEGEHTRLIQSWAFLPKGIAGFHDRFGSEADAQIAERTADAKAGIPETLAAIKATAEAG